MGDGRSGSTPERVKIDPIDAARRANGAVETPPSNLDEARLVSGSDVQSARAHGPFVEETMEEMLPTLFVGPDWTNPGVELGKAKKLFIAPSGTIPLDLARRKGGEIGPPLDENEDALLKAYWLFRRGATPNATKEDQDGIDLASKNFSPTKDLTPDQEMKLAFLTTKTLWERCKNNEPENRESPWEQLNEREEFNNALDVLSGRLKWSVIRAGADLGTPLPEPISDPEIRKDADKMHNKILLRRVHDLFPDMPADKVTEKLTRFIGGKLTFTEAKIPKLPTHEVITQDGFIQTDATRAAALHRNGQGLTRDDAINALIWIIPSADPETGTTEKPRFGATVSRMECSYNVLVSDSKKNPLLTVNTRPLGDWTTERRKRADGEENGENATAGGHGDATKPTSAVADHKRPKEPTFMDRHGLEVKAIAALTAGSYVLNELRLLKDHKKPLTLRMVRGLAGGSQQLDDIRVAAKAVDGELESNYKGGNAGVRKAYERFKGFDSGGNPADPATARDWTLAATRLDRIADRLEKGNKTEPANRVRQLVDVCTGHAANVAIYEDDMRNGRTPTQETLDAQPTNAPREELRESIRQALADAGISTSKVRFRAASIALALGLGVPTDVQANTAPNAVVDAQRRMAEGRDLSTDIVSDRGVNTVAGAEGQRLLIRDITPIDIANMKADQAKLLVSRNPADRKAGEQLAEVVKVLEGKHGPELAGEATANIRISEQADKLSGGKLLKGSGVVVGVGMLSLAAIETYKYLFPGTEELPPASKPPKPVPLK
jgi:hypothetical protein